MSEDLTGLGKLAETASQFFGPFFEPMHIVRRAKANAKALGIQTEAEINRLKRLTEASISITKKLESGKVEDDEIIVSNEGDSEEIKQLAERAYSRMRYEELRQQDNAEQVTASAYEELEQDENVSSEPVDPDWVSRFYDYAKHINDEQMQVLWGKILAGEVKQPNSFSLRTLETLRNLSKKEAEAFVRAAKLAFLTHIDALIPVINHRRTTQTIADSDMLLLNECGLLIDQQLRFTSQPIPDQPNTIAFIQGKMGVIVKRPAGTPALTFSEHKLTQAGYELLKLIDVEPNLEYFGRFGSILKDYEGVDVFYGYVKMGEGNRIDYIGLQPLV